MNRKSGPRTERKKLNEKALIPYQVFAASHGLKTSIALFLLPLGVDRCWEKALHFHFEFPSTFMSNAGHHQL